MDVIFALGYLEGVSPVSVSLRKDIPAAGSPEADKILGREGSQSSHEGSVLEDSSAEKRDGQNDNGSAA